MNKKRIAVIVEGQVRERQIFENVKKNFFSGKETFDIITLSAGLNIYMLSQKIKEDDYETDIIEVIREYNEETAKQLEGFSRDSFQEIYLFFDYDRHTNNLTLEQDMEEKLVSMIQIFDNETENGKLYISYPMVEALRDIPNAGEECYLRCCLSLEECAKYKQSSAKNLRYNQFKRYTTEHWKEIFQYYIQRLKCFRYGGSKQIDFPLFRQEICTETIHDIQQKGYMEKCNKIFILSAFPLFLLEYFTEDFWNYYIKNVKEEV